MKNLNQHEFNQQQKKTINTNIIIITNQPNFHIIIKEIRYKIYIHEIT